jgi:DNA-binding CsgD family transcriptional regulator
MKLTAQEARAFNEALRAYDRQRYIDKHGHDPLTVSQAEPAHQDPPALSDNEYADILMSELWGIVQAPAKYLNRLEAAHERLERARTRAYYPASTRYDKDRVKSSNTSDLTDTVDMLMRAEQAEQTARTAYMAAMASLDYITHAAGLDARTRRIWHLYYSGKGHTMDSIAAQMGLTRAQVKYALNGVKTQAKICMAISNIAEQNTIEEENDYAY